MRRDSALHEMERFQEMARTKSISIRYSPEWRTKQMRRDVSLFRSASRCQRYLSWDTIDPLATFSYFDSAFPSILMDVRE